MELIELMEPMELMELVVRMDLMEFFIIFSKYTYRIIEKKKIMSFAVILSWKPSFPLKLFILILLVTVKQIKLVYILTSFG
jgi:hypothetical protein